MFIQLVRICVLSWLAAMVRANHLTSSEQTVQRRIPKQIHTKGAVLESEEDNNPAETHFGGEAAAGHQGHGKYFQYQHVPHKDHYEFGYRRGNEHHFKERYEKAAPHHGHFKTKARWGDKHGGYGEHYWDYNHGDHHENDEGSDDEGDGSHPVPDYQPDYHLTGDKDDRVKREPQGGKARRGRRPDSREIPVQEEAEDQASRASPKEDTVDQSSRGDPPPVVLDHPGLTLAYDVESGTVVDEATGRRFLLTPIN